MAFNSILRRASASALPLARSIASRATSGGAISAAICVGRQSVGHPATGRQLFLPFSRFSSTASSKPTSEAALLRVLESEIDCAEQPTNADEIVPDGFPFKIEDNPGERTILLERNYQEEIIKVEVDAPSFVDEVEDDDDDQGRDAEESDHPPSIPLVVNICKENGQCLEFGITAFPDEITIDSLSIKNPDSSEDQLAYEGPDFGDLDENLQKAFHKYLEIRGIKPSTTNFLFDYMKNKDDKEYLLWLKSLKEFVEK